MLISGYTSVVVALLMSFVKCHFTAAAECPKMNVMSNFTLNEFTGIWFEYATSFKDDLTKCNYVSYKNVRNHNIAVERIEYNKYNGRAQTIAGKATMTKAGELLVNYCKDSIFDGTDLILGTDYTNYAVIYHCDILLNSNIILIYTRLPVPSVNTISDISRIMHYNFLSIEKLTYTSQENCFEDTISKAYTLTSAAELLYALLLFYIIGVI